jgi:hypothetical protein
MRVIRIVNADANRSQLVTATGPAVLVRLGGLGEFRATIDESGDLPRFGRQRSR